MGGSGPEDDSIRVPSQAFFVDGAAQHAGSQGVAGVADMPAAKAEHIHLELGEPLQLMEPVPQSSQMALEFPNISAWVPDLFGATSQKQGLLGKAFGTLHLSRSTQPQNAKPRERQVTLMPFLDCSTIWASGAAGSTIYLGRVAGQPHCTIHCAKTEHMWAGVGLRRYCSTYQGHVNPARCLR